MIATKSLSVALFSVLLWALLLVVSRVLLLIYHFDPWSFTFIQLISGGLLLIALSGSGRVGSRANSTESHTVDWRSLRRTSTWIYGLLRVTTAAAFTAALAYISVVYGGLLGTINVPLGLVGAWIFFGRRPLLNELPGHLLILGGIGVLITQLEGGLANPAVLLMLISELAVVGSSLIAEKHPDNNATDPRARRRFSGVVLLLTAGIFLVVRLVQVLALDDGVSGANLDMLLNGPLWAAGLLVGVFLRGPAMHTALQAIRLVGTETYLILVILLPFIGWGFEALASRLDIIESAPIPAFSLLLGGVIACGSLFIILARGHSHRKAVQEEKNRTLIQRAAATR